MGDNKPHKKALQNGIKTLACCLFCWAFSAFPACPQGNVTMEDDLHMGVPLGAADDVDVEICPHGARVVMAFLSAWHKGDYRVMYELIDDDSKKDYSFDQARFDFQFLQFKEYRISSVRKAGDDFEFLLSYGDWKDGNKEIKKMMISGRTFKIIMLSKNSPFKESVESYF